MYNRKIVAIVQARLTSSRFPNKILEKIENKTLIEMLINRLKKSKYLDKIVLAIPDNKKNNLLRNKIKKEIDIFTGSENDVLDRYFQAANKFKAKTIVRICGDCPLIDPKVVDEILDFYQKNNFDYVSNTIKPTYPDGLDVEVFNFETLRTTWLEAKSNTEREHVTQYIIKNKKFKKKNIVYKKDLSYLRLTIDEKIDLKQIKQVYYKLKTKKCFGIEEINKLYKKNPGIFKINSKIKRNEGSKLTTGQKMWIRAKNIIPGGNMLLSKRPEMFLPKKWPTYYSRAKGCYIWDMDDIKYTDLSLMSVGTNILGYANTKIDNAVIKSIKKSNMSTFNCPEEVYLTEKLLEMHPHFNMARFARTGGEANSIAIRIARASSGKDKVAICGYHGWHDWYLSANYNSKEKKGVLKDHLLPGLSTNGVPKNLKNTTYPFMFNDYKTLEAICNKNKIGVIKMEIFRNYAPKNNFLKKVRNLANKKNIVLIFDECTSGFRETFGGLHLKYKVNPDICILGKALGNGFPITTILGNKKVMEATQNTFISSTFWTERSGYVAGLKTLEEMKKIKSWHIISKQGKKLKLKLIKLGQKHKLKLKISGLSSCPTFIISSDKWIKYKTYITQELLIKKILGANTTYLSISHNDKIIQKYINCLDKIFYKIRKCESNDLDIDKILNSEVCHTGFKRLN
jgi:glutamate-1-semialdehyde 2,1-aminomutase